MSLAPLAPKGWPMATAPPCGFVLLRKASALRRSPAARLSVLTSGVAAKASLISRAGRSSAFALLRARASRCRRRVSRCPGRAVGDLPVIDDAGACFEPMRRAKRPETTSRKAAPSLSPGALPGVTVGEP